MEENSQGFRRARPPPRPESSSSRDTRMTPQSSSNNSSSAHLPTRSNQNTGARGGSGPSLLQERLRERKVESARQNRRRSIDLGGSGERGVQSSPVKASIGREERRPSSSGLGMGVKQIEEQVSTLHKQNFDLKLELYHRRQRQEALEARLEAAEQQIAEQRELQEVNEQLLAELEKRDQAVEEAVGIIVNLEDKIERLMGNRKVVENFEARPGYGRDGPDESSSSHPTFNEANPTIATLDTKAVARMPSFLSEQSEGADALRSLYLPNSHNQSNATLPRLPEDLGTEGMDSPRLSVLSESSFLSVYAERQLSLDAGNGEDDFDSHPRRHRKSSSVEKWIEDRPASTATPLRSLPGSRVDGLRKNQFLSINDVLESPLQRLEKLKLTLERHNNSGVSTRQSGGWHNFIEKPRSRELLRRSFTDSASFEHQQTLPPTPDTISTSTLRHYKNSNDTSSQDQQANNANERTILSHTLTFPVPNPSQNAYQSTVSMRPRSACETVTSRRDGHGWDTETQEDCTEVGSVSSTASTYSAQHLYRQPKRVMTPDLFSFNNFEDGHDDSRDWGRDMMFNNDSSARLPAHVARRYNALRRSSMAEHARSDDTVLPSNYKRDPSAAAYDNETALNHYGTNPINTSPHLNLPDRRSSLSATSKLKKANPSTGPVGITVGSSPGSLKDKGGEVKKSRLGRPRFFGRSETSDTLNGLPPQQSTTQRPRENGVSSPTYFGDGGGYDEEEVARATPPPIKRSRTTGGPAYRPSSAGTGMANPRARRGSVSGFDGAGDKAEVGAKRRSVDLGPGPGVAAAVDDNTNGVGKNGGRKWLGFGRTGSLRRT